MSVAGVPGGGRRRLLGGLAAVAALGGCGFRPLHGPGAPASALVDRVAVDVSGDRLDYHFRGQLRRRLGRAGPDAPLRLATELSLEEEGLAITPDDAITRFNVTGRARFRLSDAGGAELGVGEVTSVTAYSTLATPYATRVAERDAERRVAVDLADRVIARLVALRLDPV